MRILIFLILLPFTSLSQEREDFTFEFGANVMHYDMNLANKFIQQDSSYSSLGLNKKNKPFNSITKGKDFTFGAFYQPLQYLNFGTTISFQSAQLYRTYSYKKKADPTVGGDNYEIVSGSITNISRAFAVGLGSNVYVNRLLHFEEMPSKIVKRMSISLGLSILYGRGEFIENIGQENAKTDIKYLKYYSNDFQYRTELNVGYKLFRKSFFTTIGAKIGYQLFKTSPLVNYAGANLYLKNEPNTKINLDFSGWYFGVNFQIGK